MPGGCGISMLSAVLTFTRGYVCALASAQGPQGLPRRPLMWGVSGGGCSLGDDLGHLQGFLPL